ncbi:MAG: type I DNA topoisomerase [Flavobacteriaceae bacterium]|nr:MAG: type I DNA topoisomerase [Flavobacteriaceae bacterium]
MSKNLVIVESPAKAKTIQKFLGDDFWVESSYGHVSDLPKKGMGIDIDNNFKPEYQISPEKIEVVSRLKKKAKTAQTVWLASDEDREGEAIAWHLFNELGLKKENTKRIVFNEITKTAIQKAVQNPREIDTDLVDAQQARRILDRIVGFEVSPVLWRKVRTGLSAGRVQSVAVRLIVEREREILAFQPQSSFKVVADFATQSGELISGVLEEKLSDKKEALAFLENQKSAQYKVLETVKKPSKRSPSAPFTTSTLQQEASSKLGYSVTRTMQMAQKLYEAGHITYMRTDSVNLSAEAIASAVSTIGQKYGENYVAVRKFKNKNQGAQEAHEAIRPTDFSKTDVPDAGLSSLYKLIWKRAISSQMSDATLEKTQIKIQNNKDKHLFVSAGEVIVFDGFLRAIQEGSKIQAEGILPDVKSGETVFSSAITATQQFTKAPARYSEAALVKQLEELGIGRPSTYAPTISTIQKRQYVEMGDSEGEPRTLQILSLLDGEIKENTTTENTGANKRKLIPTDVGIVVNDFLTENFKTFMDYGFTAKVESDFDQIASGKYRWTQMLEEFYKPFHTNVEFVSQNANRASGERLLGVHPETGKNIYARIGRFGPMIQIGETEDELKPLFASLQKHQNIGTITLGEALDLFKLPKIVGDYKGEEVLVNVGRFGPYVKYQEAFVSIPRDEDPLDISLERAIELIEEKKRADAPIAYYKGLEVTKGSGRFGDYIKWNNLFINVNKKYDFSNLSQADVEELIELKLVKEKEKLVHDFSKEGIRVEKARWGRHHILQGKIKIEIGKEVDAKSLTVEDCIQLIEKSKPKKAVAKKAVKKKSTTAKTTVKKTVKKK